MQLRTALLGSVCAVLFSVSSAGANQADMSSLRRLVDAVHSQGYAQAESLVTERSKPLLKRLWNHGVPVFFPEQVALKKEQAVGQYRYLWVSPANDAQSGSLILAYTDESKKPKLDLPETFRHGFGKDWPKVVDALEKGYLMARAQVGDEAALKMMQAMLRGYQGQR